MVPDEFKPVYGRLLARQPDRFLAAREMLDGDPGAALWVCDHWTNDPEVLEALAAERAKIDDSNAMTKSRLQVQIVERMADPCTEGKDFVAMARLLAEMNKWIEKPAPTPPPAAAAQVRPRVIRAPAQSDTQWEKEAAEQQRKLLNVADSRE